MSHQVITRMAYNAKTKQIETWQHSNNVWPRTDYYYALDATDYSLIKEHAYKDIRRSVPGLSFTSPDDKFVKPRF